MLKTESSCSVGLLCVVIESKRERVAPDGVESVPGAIATGSVNVTMDRYVSCDPVATLYMKGRPNGGSLELI